MSERAVQFGHGLMGVVSEPEASARAPGRPAVLLLNAGLLHRVGPNRIHVRIARRLARAGHVALRFDFAGIGDSEPRADRAPFEAYALSDTSAAMDHLQAAYGVQSFLLFGLCLGADVALQVAYRDDRVMGALLVNGSYLERLEATTVRTQVGQEEDLAAHARARTTLRYYRSRVLHVRPWLRLLRGQTDMRALRSAVTGLAGLRRRRAGRPTEPPPASMRMLVDRGARVLLVYSEGSSALDLFKLRWKRSLLALDAGDRLRVELVRHVDHVFTPLWAQERLIELICGWSADTRSAAGS